MGRIPLVDRDELPSDYDILKQESTNLHEDMDIKWWKNQATLRTYANNMELGKTHVTTNVSLWTRSGLTREEVEYVILSVAQALESKYIWHDHVVAALERSKIGVEEIIAIAKNDIKEYNEKHQALIKYSFEFVNESGRVNDETFNQLEMHYNDGTIVGITMLAAYYIFIEYTARALHIPFNKNFIGWELEDY